jgi:hypothetical protein
VEDPKYQNHSDEEPMQSLATASRLANIGAKEEKQKEEQLPHFSDLGSCNEGAISNKKSKFKPNFIDEDFSNVDDVIDQGQGKEKNYDNYSQHNVSRDFEQRESLTFKPDHILRSQNPKSSDVPMSFGNNILHRGNDYDD